MTNKNIWQLGNLHTQESEVMGLPDDVIFAHGQWQGFLMDESKTSEILSLINTQAQWKTRFEAEKDPDWQQIYPYALFKYKNYYGEFKRGVGASDTRMNLKYSLAVGGHVFKTDYQQTGSLDNFIQAIFHQDMEYEGNINSKCIGVLNDNSDDLGRYHVGIVYIIEGDLSEISSKIHTETRLVKLAEITGEDVDFLERWSQMVYRQLREQENETAHGLPKHFHVSHLMDNSS